MTTDCEPVAKVPRKRPARKSKYGRRARSDEISSDDSSGSAVLDTQHFPEATVAKAATKAPG
jgi:hypothetical protein